MKRILWNRRPTDKDPGGDIDEIVMDNVTIHIEQMDTRCWWIGIYCADGADWSGNFVADSRGRMTFCEQDNEGVDWDRDDAHDATS